MPTPDLAIPPAGWFLFEVVRKESRKWDWVALMVDTAPELAPVLLRPRSCYVRIPGKHRDPAAALDAFQAMVATRH